MPSALSSAWTPNESSEELWLERSNFAGLFLGGVAYGFHACVFFCTIYFMLIRSPTGTRLSKLFLAALFMLFAMGTITIACTAKFSEQMWIDYRSIPGGPNAFLAEHYDIPVNVLGNAAYIVANFIADVILIYRLWIIYERSYIALLLPSLAFLASTVFSLFTLIQSAQPGASLWSETTFSFAVPYWCLTISLNIFVTLMISARLFWMRSVVVNALGSDHARAYTSVAATIIESAALYSGTGLIFIISYARNSNVQNLVLPVLGQVMCIAPELIILRIGLGRAWSHQMTVTATRQAPTEKDQHVSPQFNFRIGRSVGQTSTISITGTACASNGTMSASSAVCEYDLGLKEKDFWDVNAHPFDMKDLEKV